MLFQQLSKLELQVSLESNLLNRFAGFQAFGKTINAQPTSKHDNRSPSSTIPQKRGFVDALKNKVACKLVAYQDMAIGCENGDSRAVRVEIY